MTTGYECFVAVRRGSHNGHSRVADLEPAHAVLQGNSHIPPRLGFSHDARAFGFYHRRVRRVLEAKNLPAVVMVSDGAKKARDSAPLRGLRRGNQGRQIYWMLAEVHQLPSGQGRKDRQLVAGRQWCCGLDVPQIHGAQRFSWESLPAGEGAQAVQRVAYSCRFFDGELQRVEPQYIGIAREQENPDSNGGNHSASHG